MRANGQLEDGPGAGGPNRVAGGVAAPRPSAAAVLTNRALTSEGWLEVVPALCNSQFDAIGGCARRCMYRERLEALAASMYRGVLVTLTLDREAFADAAEGYRVSRARVADCMREALGDHAVWGQVVEFQTATGEGWPHYHLVGELRQGVSLSFVRGAIRRCWAERWKFGRCLDVTLIKDRLATARYLGKYLTKAPAAVPHWILHRERSPRMFSSSWAGGERLATLGVRRPPTVRHSQRTQTEDRMRARRAARVKSTLLDRLACSGTRCKVRKASVDPIGEVRFSWLPRLVQAPFWEVCQVADHAVARRAEFRHLVPLEDLARALEDQFGDLCEVRAGERRDAILAAWDSS